MENEFSYLVLMRNCIKKQLFFFEELKDDIDTINSTSCEIVNDDKLLYDFNQQNDRESIKTKISELNFLLEIINKKIKDTCFHEYCEDTIDINEDTIKYIKYCEKCWTTFES